LLQSKGSMNPLFCQNLRKLRDGCDLNTFFNTDYATVTNMFIRVEKIKHPTTYPHLADTANINGSFTSEKLNSNKPGFRIWQVGASVEGGIYMRHKGRTNIAWIDGHVSASGCTALTVLNIAHVDAPLLFRHNFTSAQYDY